MTRPETRPYRIAMRTIRYQKKMDFVKKNIYDARFQGVSAADVTERRAERRSRRRARRGDENERSLDAMMPNVVVVCVMCFVCF